VPSLATYEWQFSALVAGSEPQNTLPAKVLDAYASTGTPPKTLAIVTSKFPSTQDMAKGAQGVAKARGLQEVAFLEYDVGNRDYGPIAARSSKSTPISCSLPALVSRATNCSRR